MGEYGVEEVGVGVRGGLFRKEFIENWTRFLKVRFTCQYVLPEHETGILPIRLHSMLKPDQRYKLSFVILTRARRD